MTDRTKTISVRLPVEIVDDLNKRLSKEDLTLRDFLSSYVESGSVNRESSKSETPLGVNTDITDNLSQMASFMWTDLGGLVSALNDGLEDGSLSYENGRLVGQSELKMDRFYEICHDRNLDRQKAFDRLVNMLERS